MISSHTNKAYEKENKKHDDKQSMIMEMKKGG